MRIALVHDHLLRFGGAERVLQTLHQMYPQAPIYTLVCDRRIRERHFPGADIRTSGLNRIPGITRGFRGALPLLPFSVESFDLREYDTVLSSVSGLAKGVITRTHTKHICYCHTPPRFLWEDREAYLRRHAARLVRPWAAALTHALRLWDQNTAQRVDRFVANSGYTAQRISRYYKRDADVLHPPVDVSTHPCLPEVRAHLALPREFFLFAGRLAWWKRPELAVETFNRMGLPLVIMGEGPLERTLRQRAKANIRFLGWQPDEIVRQGMNAATALVHPQTEDFGMTAVEAMAEGVPVIAFRRGGAAETVQEGISGEFFDDLDPVALADAVRRLREGKNDGKYDPEKLKAEAQRFAPAVFQKKMRGYLEAAGGGDV